MITVHRITNESVGTLGFTIVIDRHDDMVAFQQLVQRGANLWPDATPAIKAFADEITSGKVLQDYSKQDTSPKKECEHVWIAKYFDGSTRLGYVCKYCNIRT